MIKTEFYGIFLVLLVSFVSIGVSGLCIVNVTVEGGPVIRFKENEGIVSVILKRTGNTTIEAKVNVSTDENTAKAGADKDFLNIPSHHTVTFTANSDTAAFNITIIDDHWMEELVKTFFVNMTTNDANVCTPLPTTTIEIEDDDKVTVGFHDDFRTFSENHGNFSLKFFKRQNQTKLPITVSFSTPGIGNAAINVDYKNISGSMTFQQSQFTKDFPGKGMIIDNVIVEATKCFNITLTASEPAGIKFDPQQSKICITNDDKATFEFATSSVNTTVAEQKKNVSLDIIKTGKTAISIKVRLNMLQQFFETAKAGEDFTSRHNDIITFGKDEAKKTLWFTINDDSVAESNEVFVVRLEAVDSSTTIIGAKNLAVIEIDDEEDRVFLATTQKQKEDEQKRRTQLLTVLLCVAVALIVVIIAGMIIVVFVLQKRLKK